MDQTSQDEDSSKARMYIPKKAFLSRMQSYTSESQSSSGNNLLSTTQMSIPEDLRLSFSEIDDTPIPLDDLDFNCSPASDLDLASSNIVSLENVKELRDDKDLHRISTAISSSPDTSIFSPHRMGQNGMGFDTMDSQIPVRRQYSAESVLNPYNIDNRKKDTQATICSSTKLSTSSDMGLGNLGDKSGLKRTWEGPLSQNTPWPKDIKAEAPQVSTVGSSGEVLQKKKMVSPRRGSKNKHMENKLCQVCGDIAAGFYCGAFICEACKKFYMRAYKQDKMKYVCLRDKNCIITKESRVQCQFCRFQKCVNLNMHCPKQGEENPTKDMNITDIPCRVCSAPSSGFHFGAITCEGCKGFFRRMAKEREIEKYQCNKKGQCEINMITRNLCKACRYRQCIVAGMSVEGSRIGRQPNSVKHAISMELKHHVKPDTDRPPSSMGDEIVQIKEEPLDEVTTPDKDMKADDLSFWDSMVTSDYQTINDTEFSRNRDLHSSMSNSTASDTFSAYQPMRDSDITADKTPPAQSPYQHNKPVVSSPFSHSQISSQWSLSTSHSQLSSPDKTTTPQTSPTLHSPPVRQLSPPHPPQPHSQYKELHYKHPQALLKQPQPPPKQQPQIQHKQPQTPLIPPQIQTQQKQPLTPLIPPQIQTQTQQKQPLTQHNLLKQPLTQQNILKQPLTQQNILKQPLTQQNILKQPLTQQNTQIQPLTQQNQPKPLQPLLSEPQGQKPQHNQPEENAQSPSTSQSSAVQPIFPAPGRDPMFLLVEGQQDGGGNGIPPPCPENNEQMDDFLDKIIEAGKVLQLLNYRVFDADMTSTTSMDVEDIKSLFKSKYMDPRMGNKILPNIDMSILATKESTWSYMMTNFHHNTYITIRFAKMVPGFKSLLLNDQVKLIQYSIYPIELLNMSKVYDVETRTYNYFTYTKEEENIMMNHFPMLKVFQDHLHHVGEMVCSFEFTDEEFALLSALLLFPAEIHGLEDPGAVDELQSQISSALQYYEEKTFPDGLTRYGILLVRVAELVQCLLQHNLAIGLLLTYNPRIQVPQLFHELIIESIQEGKKT